jgi:hypothetical protein
VDNVTTDCDFVLSMLEEGPATTMMLIRQSINARGCGLTPHSRVADLRRGGYDIRCARVGSKDGRGIYQYTLVSEPVTHPTHPPGGLVEAPAVRASDESTAPSPTPVLIEGQLVLVR